MSLKSPEDLRRDKYYRSTYGITLDDYNSLRRKQRNRCAICKRPETDFKQRLSVDHDHTTREVRGLLCFLCNHRLIGRRRSADAPLFAAAARYLKKGTGWFVPEKKKRKTRRKRH